MIQNSVWNVVWMKNDFIGQQMLTKIHVSMVDPTRITIRLPKLSLKPRIADYRLPYDSQKLRFRDSHIQTGESWFPEIAYSHLQGIPIYRR